MIRAKRLRGSSRSRFLRLFNFSVTGNDGLCFTQHCRLFTNCGRQEGGNGEKLSKKELDVEPTSTNQRYMNFTFFH